MMLEARLQAPVKSALFLLSAWVCGTVGVMAAGADAPARAPWEKQIAKVTLVESGPPLALPVQDGEPPGNPGKKSAPPRLYAPYPVKISPPPPEGWALEEDPGVPGKAHKVRLSDGRTLEFAVTPPVLKPVRPGAQVVQFAADGGPTPRLLLAQALQNQAESKARIHALLEMLQAHLPADNPPGAGADPAAPSPPESPKE